MDGYPGPYNAKRQKVLEGNWNGHDRVIGLAIMGDGLHE